MHNHKKRAPQWRFRPFAFSKKDHKKKERDVDFLLFDAGSPPTPLPQIPCWPCSAIPVPILLGSTRTCHDALPTSPQRCTRNVFPIQRPLLFFCLRPLRCHLIAIALPSALPHSPPPAERPLRLSSCVCQRSAAAHCPRCLVPVQTLAPSLFPTLRFRHPGNVLVATPPSPC